ncbi:MAG: Cof-type HAD-IIB family hydrolase [Synergistaceae bacterium]
MSYRPKLIALDMDGTLLNSKSKLTPRTKDVLQRAVRSGIKIMIATGRMYPSALPIIREIGTEFPCVFYNGAVVRRPASGEKLYELGIGKELTSEVMDFYIERNWYIQVYHEDNLYVVDENDPRAKFYESISGISPIALGNDFRNFRTDSTKLLGIAGQGEDFAGMAQATKERFADRLYTATSWGAFVEMVNPSVNKAKGIEIAAGSEGISKEDVMAVGDAANDKEMVEWAGVGVAMGNATDALKTSADEIAGTNDEDGVAALVERYLDR